MDAAERSAGQEVRSPFQPQDTGRCGVASMTGAGSPKVCQPIEMDSHTGAHTSFYAQKEEAG